MSEYKIKTIEHKANAQKVLRECTLLLCAFSMVESWITNDGVVFPLARSTWRANPRLVRPYKMKAVDVKNSIKKIYTMIKRHNNNWRILIGVDREPLHATHDEESCIMADSIAKASLVTGIREAIRELSDSRIGYVPFFKRFHYCTRDRWDTDERHISNNACKIAYN